MRIVLLALILNLIGIFGNAQEEHIKTHENHEHGPHQLGIMVGYAWVPNAFEAEGDQRAFAIPAVGLDYSYWIKHNWGLRFVNDVELSRYLVEQEDGQLLQREFKYIGALVGIWEPLDHLAIFAGPGYEIETHENFFVAKIGAEVVKNFEEGWSTGFNVSVDINKLYSTYSAGLFIARRL